MRVTKIWLVELTELTNCFYRLREWAITKEISPFLYWSILYLAWNSGSTFVDMSLLQWIGFRWRTETEQKIYLKLEKTADISRRHLLVPREMMSEEQAQKFHIDDLLLPRCVIVLWLVKANFPCGTPDQSKASDTSLVWNLCSRCSDVSWRENQWRHREMSVVSHVKGEVHSKITVILFSPTKRLCKGWLLT